MIDARVSIAIRTAIHFGKWVVSTVPLVLVLLEKEFDFNNDVKSLEQRVDGLVRELIRRYVVFYKLRRRAWKIAGRVYPNLSGSRDARDNVALKRLIGRMEETAGKLDSAMQESRKELAVDEGLHQYAVSLWRDRPNPPPLVELEVLRWGFHELEEDCLLDMDFFDRLNRGENPVPRPWMRKRKK
jgi:hypothetical protein